MSIIPSPDEAAQLRTLFAGNPVIDAAEAALRAFGETLHVRNALRLLETWSHSPELSEREYRAVLARFVPPPAHRCVTCLADIEYVVDRADPGWWRQASDGTGRYPVLAFPHGAAPLFCDPQGGQLVDGGWASGSCGGAS